MTLKSTNVSVEGDRDYVQVLKQLAARRNITLAKLTRMALDTVYGDEVQEMIFFNQAVAQKLHPEFGGNGNGN